MKNSINIFKKILNLPLTHCQLCWLDHEPPHQWGYNQPFSSLTANPEIDLKDKIFFLTFKHFNIVLWLKFFHFCSSQSCWTPPCKTSAPPASGRSWTGSWCFVSLCCACQSWGENVWWWDIDIIRTMLTHKPPTHHQHSTRQTLHSQSSVTN